MYELGQDSIQATHVWVRVDLVQALHINQGELPKGWSPRKRVRDDGDSWGWCRAVVHETRSKSTKTDSSVSTSPFGHVRLRPTKTRRAAFHSQPLIESPQSTTAVTVTVDDSELAPPQLNQVTVSFSYESSDSTKLCTANAWWASKNACPPDDLCRLEQLHEPAVVFCLRWRYAHDEIYTYTGKILLALNPFRALTKLYGPEIMNLYSQRTYTGDRPPPHIYAVAEDAYKSMLESLQYSSAPLRLQQHDQSILVSGESGSGKTVSTKIIMKYLATLSSYRCLPGDSTGIESQVLLSNPILESFGNGRTLRNDNSSRFGKFIEIHFSVSGCLVSASIKTYLLEKTRLVAPSVGERNYHIFYEMLAGLSPRDKGTLYLHSSKPADFRMLGHSRTFERRDGVEDRSTFTDLRHAMKTVGFTKVEELELFSVASALLHASNLSFVSTGESCTINRACSSFRPFITLLGVNAEKVSNALTKVKIEARGEVLMKNLDSERAQKTLEALIKTTYEAMFLHIVRQINRFISTVEVDSQKVASIGVLDIFGFEAFAVNSFEQLCINYCNEALQQQFNRFVFKLEQQEYRNEGIEWSFISFPDNQDVLDLIEKKHGGILSILDEQCRLPRCSDSMFARSVYEQCQHLRFHASKSQQARFAFSISHYAGSVEYDSTQFLEKNKNELPIETTDLLKSSSHPFVVNLALGILQEGNKTGFRKQVLKSSLTRESVGSEFRTQLRELRQRIESTSPHYVRCLKPNDNLQPRSFNELVIADQLRCAGVLEAIRVSRIGFPHRYTHARFVDRYSLLLPTNAYERKCQPDCQTLVDVLTPKVQSDESTLEMQLGKTTVFLRKGAFDSLEYLRGRKLESSAASIQAMVRMYLQKVVFRIIRCAVIVLQKFVRRIGSYRKMLEYRIDASILTMQRVWRAHVARRIFHAAKFIAFWSQSVYRGAIARQYCAYVFLDQKVAVIQRLWRHRNRNLEPSFRLFRKAVICLQNRHRGRVAVYELNRKRRTASDLNPVAAERDLLKAETRRLQGALQDAAEANEVESLRRQVELLKSQLNTAKAHESEMSLLDQAEARFDDLSNSMNIGNPPPQEVRYLHNAIRQCNPKLVHQILDQTGNTCGLVNLGNQQGKTALHVAAQTRKLPLAILALLLEHGAVVNAQDADGETPLHLSESTSMIKMLLDKGRANPNIPNVDGICALHLAVQRRDADTVQALLRHNARVDTADHVRWMNPLHLIVLPARVKLEVNGVWLRIANMLCTQFGQHKPDLDFQDREGNTPLHYAVQLETGEAFSLTRIFLEKGADPNMKNERNQSPLHLLCHNQELRRLDTFHDIVQSMLAHGACPNATSLTGCTPLHLAIFHHDLETAVLLIKADATLHLPWKKVSFLRLLRALLLTETNSFALPQPSRWPVHWKDMGTNEVLALDMVEDEHELRHLLSALARPQQCAPTRPWCMHCKSTLGTHSRAVHCKHCSRLVCGKCATSCLPPKYFPKVFDVLGPCWVCSVCEIVLLSRLDDAATSDTDPSSNEGNDRFSF